MPRYGYEDSSSKFSLTANTNADEFREDVNEKRDSLNNLDPNETINMVSSMLLASGASDPTLSANPFESISICLGKKNNQF